jgi:hypothetical protein
MSMDKLDSNALQFGDLIRFALTLCTAAGFVYALVWLRLWHGVINLN